MGRTGTSGIFDRRCDRSEKRKNGVGDIFFRLERGVDTKSRGVGEGTIVSVYTASYDECRIVTTALVVGSK